MSNLCMNALKAWVEQVDSEITTVTDVNTLTRQWDDGKYQVWSGNHLSGAYWALRAMIRDEREFVECYMRMEEYLDAKCKAVMAINKELDNEL